MKKIIANLERQLNDERMRLKEIEKYVKLPTETPPTVEYTYNCIRSNIARMEKEIREMEKIKELKIGIKKSAALKNDGDLLEISLGSYEVDLVEGSGYKSGRLYFMRDGGIYCYFKRGDWNSDKFEVTDEGFLKIVDREKLIVVLRGILLEVGDF